MQVRVTSHATNSKINFLIEKFWGRVISRQLSLGHNWPPYIQDVNPHNSIFQRICSKPSWLNWTRFDSWAAVDGRGRCSTQLDGDAAWRSYECAQMCQGVPWGVWRPFWAFFQIFLKNDDPQLFSSIFEYELQCNLSDICRLLLSQFAWYGPGSLPRNSSHNRARDYLKC